MNRIRQCCLFILLSCSLLMSCASPAKTVITFWHAMGGSLNNTVQTITNRFNHSQNKYTIIPVYKGSYSEVLTSTVAAFRAGQQPTIVQVFEAGTGFRQK